MLQEPRKASPSFKNPGVSSLQLAGSSARAAGKRYAAQSRKLPQQSMAWCPASLSSPYAYCVFSWCLQDVVVDPNLRRDRPPCIRASGCGPPVGSVLKSRMDSTWLLVEKCVKVAIITVGGRSRVCKQAATAGLNDETDA